MAIKKDKYETKEISLKQLLIILAVIIIILVIVSIFSNSKTNSNTNSNNNSETKTKLQTVTDYSTFFTIENCINKYINAITNSKNEDLFNLLTTEYKNLNSINKDNILEKIEHLDGNYVFEAYNEFIKVRGSNIKEYYVYGLLKEDVLGGYDKGKDQYYQVIVENDSYTFTLRPYTIEEYRKVVQ